MQVQHSKTPYSFYYWPRILIGLGMMLCAYTSNGQNDRNLYFSLIPDSTNTYKQDSIAIDRLLTQSDTLLTSDYDSAFSLLQKAYQISTRRKMKAEKTKVMALLATYYLRKGDFNKSITLIEEALKEAESIKDGNRLAYLHNAAGVIYQETGLYPNSAIHYFKALNIIQQYNLYNTNHAAQTYNNLGTVWLMLDEKQQALNTFLAAKKLQKSNYTLPYILFNIGLVYADSNKAVALRSYMEGLSVAQKQRNFDIMYLILIHISALYLDLDNYPAALNYLQQAKTVDSQLNSVFISAITDYQIGQYFLKTRAYPKADYYLQQSLASSKKTGGKDLLLGLYQSLAELNAVQGNYQKAYSYQQDYITYSDSLQHTEKSKTVDMLLQYQSAEKDKEIVQKQLQLNVKEGALKEKNIWIAVTLGGVILLLVLLAQAYRNNKTRQRLQNEQLHNYTQQQEIEKLKAVGEGEEKERTRIAHDLHDGVMVRFATVKMKLNTLPDEVPALEDTAAYKQILKQFDQATSELRQTAHNLMPSVLLEEGIAQAIYYFCKTIEDTSGLQIAFQQYGTLPRLEQEFEIAIYRIIQELVQNIIKHAAATKAIVQLNCSENILSLTIEDNGKGFYTSIPTAGLGLKSIRHRIQIFKGSFDIQSTAGHGTTAYMECDLQPYLNKR